MGIDLFDIAIWWLVLEITGFLVLPIASFICGNLKDHGYSVSKPLGLLFLTYISWIFSVFAGYSFISILFSFGVIGVFSFIILLTKGKPRIDKRYMINFEIIFGFAFLVFALIRAYSPDIYWTGGEKFMDITFINSLLRTAQFPPQDPWMSGTVVYYYYFGYLIVADLIKITGVLPGVAFNLSTASFFALSLTTALGIGYNLTEKLKFGILIAFFVTIAGNITGFLQLMVLLLRKEDAMNGILSFNYWTGSRVIPDTITEFPFFSFLQGDVHAHMIAITFQLLIIYLLLNIIKSDEKGLPLIFILALSIGFLYPLNTWDYPVYLFISFMVISFSFVKKPVRSIKEILKPVSVLTALAAASYFLYFPYHNTYKLDRAISFYTGERTLLVYYLAFFGLFLFLLYAFVIVKHIKSWRKLALSAIFLIFISVILKFELMIVLIPLLVLSAISIIKEKDSNHVFVFILMISGVLISLFCELFYIQDALGSSNFTFVRLNTVFKLYLQNWILWGIAAGYMMFYFRESFPGKKIWSIAAVILILMASAYPVFATIGKSAAFRGEPTLDGEAWFKKQHPQDYAAVLWFRNISGRPVVLQAPGELYQFNTYMTAFTGLPTVIGWAGHELNWRYPDRKEIDIRWSDANTIYTSRDPESVIELVKKYNISYIYFGEAEAKRYTSPRFFYADPGGFEKVFEYGDIEVYKVRPNR